MVRPQVLALTICTYPMYGAANLIVMTQSNGDGATLETCVVRLCRLMRNPHEYLRVSWPFVFLLLKD